MSKQLTELIEWMDKVYATLDSNEEHNTIEMDAYANVIAKAKSLQSEEPIMYTQEEMDIQIEFSNKEYERGWKDRSEFYKVGLKNLDYPEIYTKADLISKEDALGFAEWTHKRECKYWYSLTRNSFIELYTNKEITTEELFTLYQQTK